MKRTPMRRTAFTRTQPERPPRQPATPIRQCRVSDPRSTAAAPAPKRIYVRSSALLDACGLIDCQRCGRPGAVGAHSNWAIHGKGRGIKADDNRIAALCARCHKMIDEGTTLGASVKRAAWWGAHVSTVRALIANCLWPVGVPAPDLSWPKEWE